MRLALVLLLLPCAVHSQFFGNQQNPQNQQQQQNQHIPWVGPQRDSPGLHPNQYQPGSVLNQPYAQRTGQQNAGGIMRPNSAVVPNSQTNQHPIFDLMRNQHISQARQTGQTNQNMYQNQAQQPQAQPNPYMSNQNPQFNPNNANNQQQHQQSQFQQQNFQQNSQNQQRQQQVDPRPRAFNRLSNRVDQWTGSSGVNSPGILTTPNRGAAVLNPGATFNIQLTSYVNERLAMKGGMTCYCPREECTIIENILHPCYFSFTIVIGTSSGEPVHYISKQFVAVNSSGSPNQADGDWTVPVSLQLVSKPTYVDIFVNNLGPVIQGRTVNYLDEFWQVDTFTLDLTDYQPTIANQQPTPVNTRINGQLVGSNLELSYYVQCQSSFFGENCDLTCRPTKSQNPPRSICTSRITNSSSVCGTNNSQGQVQNCQPCGFGVINDECADLANYNGRELGVSSAFRVWTIVLAILLAIAIIFILILIIMYVLAERKLKNEQAQDHQDQRTNGNGNGHNGRNGTGAYENGRREISNPLLANEWDKPAPPHAFIHHGVESESNHSGSAPRPGIPTTSAFQPPRREAQV